MESLDLHGIKHRKVEDLVDSFIMKYFHLLPVEIITGNSADMQTIVKKVVQSHKLKMEPSTHINLGSYVISHKK